jgi:hypothetical protein
MLGRFTSPDSIIPDPGSVIGYNRYAYVNNNPMIYTDPSGHSQEGGIGDPSCGPNDFLCQTVWDPNNPYADEINYIFASQVPGITNPGGVASTEGWDTDPA